MRSLFAFFALFSISTQALGQAEIAIGSKKFTESYVLGEIAKMLVEQAGLKVIHRAGLGGTIILWQALLHGDIAFYPEYTGTISEEILRSGTRDIEAIRRELALKGIGMMEGLGFDNNYTLTMRRDRAAELSIRSIADLQRHPDLKAGPTAEFLGRQDGWVPLVARYGLSFASVRGLEHGLGYAALASGAIDIKDSYTTDAKIAEFGLVSLADPLHFFPRYEAVFLYRLDAPAKAIRAIARLQGRIDEKRMIALNRIAEETKSYGAAAAAFFEDDDGKSAEPGRGRRLFELLSPLPRLTAEHLTLVAISLAAAIAASLPLGMLASRQGLLSEMILGAVGVIQTIPSLALLALMIPIFGIGQLPAIVALFLYSLLPIVRGTASGLRSIPASLREAAAALGFRRTARVWLIDLPMASPSVLAGIKTSAVISVGTATLAGLIGGGGYGEPIQSGLQLNDNATILQGAIPAALLALFVQAAFTALDNALIPRGLRLDEEAAGSSQLA